MNDLRFLADAFADTVISGKEYVTHAYKDLNRLANRAEDAWDDAQNRSIRAARAARQSIRSHPIGLAGASLIAGVAVGAFIGIGMRRRT